MANTLKAKYIEKFGLKDKYTEEELDLAFKNAIKELASTPNLTKSYFIENVLLLNNAVSMLSESSIIDDKDNVFSKIVCNKLGITYEEANIIYRRLRAHNKTDLNFEMWLNTRKNNRDKYEDKKEDILARISQLPQLLLIRYDRLVSMYEGDLEFGGINNEFESWIKSLVSLSKFMIDNKIELIIDKEYREYINDLTAGTSYIKYLSDKAVEMDICKKLGISYYDAKQNYNHKVSGLSFKSYLESILSFKDQLAKLDITIDKLEEYYEEYKRRGYSGSKLEFAQELANSIDYCIELDCGYFVLKEQYDSLPKSSKPESFNKWLEIEKVVYKLGGYAKIMEALYKKELANGYSGEMLDLFKILTGIKPVD